MKHTPTQASAGQQGLTLVELLVAMALAAMVSFALVTTFTSYSRTQTVQDNVIAMQQNLRAALYLMGRDLRMAGYRGPDPTSAPAAGFVTANASNLTFTVVDDATNTLTTVSYQYFDSDGDGTNDAIRRSDATMTDVLVAEDIDGVEFYYTLSDGSRTTAPAALGNIRSVELAVLARTARSDRDFTNPTAYTRPSGDTWGPYNDGRRRRLAESVILFRNM